MNDFENFPTFSSTVINNNLISLFLYGDGNFDDWRIEKY